MSEGVRKFVFVAVGNANQNFTRLLSAVDKLSGQGFFGKRDVIIQTGTNSNFVAAHSTTKDYFPSEDFEGRIARASLIICHGGVGVIFQAISAGRVPVVMPRRFCYGEHVDDHQVEMVEALAAEGRVVPAFEVSDLPGAIHIADKRAKLPAKKELPPMLRLVEQAIQELQ